jgi:hypothetical protein
MEHLPSSCSVPPSKLSSLEAIPILLRTNLSSTRFNSISLSLPSNTKVQDESHKILESCPTERYLFVAQPNIHMSHLASSTAAPKLQAALNSDKTASQIKVTEMVGTIDLLSVEDFVRRSCKAVGKKVSIDMVNLTPLPTSRSEKELQDALKATDEDLGIVLSQYDAAGDYTVIFTAGKSTEKAEESYIYEAEFKDTTHQELKRQLGQIQRRANATDNRPLFEKYQFFTPGKVIPCGSGDAVCDLC